MLYGCHRDSLPSETHCVAIVVGKYYCVRDSHVKATTWLVQYHHQEVFIVGLGVNEIVKHLQLLREKNLLLMEHAEVAAHQ